MKDPFEAALEEQQQSPPESPAPPDDEPLEDDAEVVVPQAPSSASTPIPSSSSSAAATAGGGGGGGGVGGGPVGRGKEEEEDEDEEENMDVEIGRITSSSGDPDKMAKMQTGLRGGQLVGREEGVVDRLSRTLIATAASVSKGETALATGSPIQWHIRFGHLPVERLRRFLPHIPASTTVTYDAC